MTEQEQVSALYESQATTELERELVESLPARVDPFRDRASHVVDLYEVVLETGRLTYFKPLNAYQRATAPLKRALLNYSHTPVSTLLSECGAWQLAKNLDGIWEEVGSLAVFRPGSVRTRAYFQAVPQQAAAGAFFDCVIGQQDRNRGNVLWQEERQRIYLIDHGFAFGRPGDQTGELELSVWRWQHGSRGLTDPELAAAAELVEHDLYGARDYLDDDRASAVLDRLRRMRQDAEILRPGAL